GHHRNILPVLGGGANHGGSADVDILDQLFQSGFRSSRDFLKLIEIHHHQVNARNAVLGDRVHMSGFGAHGENPTVHHRVQRLHAAVQHFGELGDFSDLLQRSHAGFLQDFEGSAGGE